MTDADKSPVLRVMFGDDLMMEVHNGNVLVPSAKIERRQCMKLILDALNLLHETDALAEIETAMTAKDLANEGRYAPRPKLTLVRSDSDT